MKKAQILIVEDESVVALDLESRLTNLGYSVAAVVSAGEDAIRKAEALHPDLMLMDIQLKGHMDGVEAADEIRTRFDIPVIYLTAYTDLPTLQRAKITEPFGYLLKPFRERELHTTIEMALYKHRMDRRVKESEQWLATTLRSIGDAVIRTDARGRIQFMNPVAEALTGWKQEQALGKDLDQVLNIVQESTRAPITSPIARVRQDRDVVHLHTNVLLIAKDGTEIPINDSAAPIRDDAGDIIGVVLVFRDVTARRQSEKALQESQQLLRMTFTGLRDALFIVSSDPVEIIDCNPAASEMFGYRRQEMLGQAVNFLHVDDAALEQFRAYLYRAVEEQGYLYLPEFRMKRKDGTIFPTEHSTVPLEDEMGQRVGWVSVVRDITERVRVQKEIERRNEGLAALNAVSAAAVSSLELYTVLRQILERTCQALDAAEGSILLRDPNTGELFFAVSLTEQLEKLSHHRLAPGQGIAGWVVQHGEPLRVNDVREDPRWYMGTDMITGFETHSLLCAPLAHRGSITGVIEIVNKHEGEFSQDDLSLLIAMASIAAAAFDNARLYSASQARVRELALLNEIALTVSSTLDHDKVIRAALSLTQRLFQADGIFLLQYASQTDELGFLWALIGTRPVEIPLHLSQGEGIAGWALAQGRAVLVKDAQNDSRYSPRLDKHLGTRTRALMAVPLLTPERSIGVLQIVSWQASIYTSDDLRALQSIASTLAVALENARLYGEQNFLLKEREQAQVQLIHSEKMSALGRLAASIAHEINNPLQAIQGCLTLAEEELEDAQRQDKLTRYLGIVGSEIERIATIVRRMREFYRPVREGRIPADVHEVLTSVLDLSNKQLQHSSITVERHWLAGLPQIQVNPDHLKQVFLNLVLNAIDAMPHGGILRISTGLDRIQADRIPPDSVASIIPVEAVRIDFADTGVGMSPEIQSRLFEPFFTAKEHGSGLGLSISYGIIESHNGQIKVQSQEEVGTTFTILLPTANVRPAWDDGVSERVHRV